SLAADPARSAAVLLASLFSGIGFPLAALGLKLMVDAVVNHSLHRAQTGALVFAVGLGGYGAALLNAFLQVRLQENVGHRLDQLLIRLANQVPGLEHFENPVLADRVALIRAQRGALTQPATPLFQLLSTVIGTISALVFAYRVHP